MSETQTGQAAIKRDHRIARRPRRWVTVALVACTLLLCIAIVFNVRFRLQLYRDQELMWSLSDGQCLVCLKPSGSVYPMQLSRGEWAFDLNDDWWVVLYRREADERRRVAGAFVPWLYLHDRACSVGVPLVSVCAGMAWLVWRRFVAHRKAARGLACRSCGYDLSGLRSPNTCPECGHSLA